MSSSNIEVGKRLKLLRNQLELSQQDFGEKIGIPNKATISKYEKGQLEIAAKAEVELYTTLGVNKEWLLHGTGPMFVENKGTQATEINEPIQSYVKAPKEGTSFLNKLYSIFIANQTVENMTKELQKDTFELYQLALAKMHEYKARAEKAEAKVADLEKEIQQLLEKGNNKNK